MPDEAGAHGEMSTQLAIEETVRPLHHLQECPSVWLAEEFLNPDECQRLIAMAQGKLKQSHTLDMETGTDMLSEGRTSSLVCLKWNQDAFITEIEARLAALTNYPTEHGEGLQLLNYQIGQEYRPHYDFFDPERSGSMKALAIGGQRVLTILIYLNTVEHGGETFFPKVPLSIKPCQGDALMFYNTYKNGEIDWQSLHGSYPVAKGEKWIATKWIRQFPIKRNP